jgi:hypothetical protein
MITLLNRMCSTNVQGFILRTLELLMEMIMDDILLKKGLTCIYLKYNYR